ncbi:MAG: hypothetical protein ABIC91_00605 [Nanoarchaeota archaeon]|nr:hypothetical protein [Nanoarchaeota archaeon]MBU1029737.1 hypothetical protein [Nanoarchaeota archaeon]MBU1849164.1 hypothetical protein [Nanoarchaeota archaeon]
MKGLKKVGGKTTEELDNTLIKNNYEFINIGDFFNTHIILDKASEKELTDLLGQPTATMKTNEFRYGSEIIPAKLLLYKSYYELTPEFDTTQIYDKHYFYKGCLEVTTRVVITNSKD